MPKFKNIIFSGIMLASSQIFPVKQDWYDTYFIWNLGLAAHCDKGLAFRPYYHFLFQNQFYPAFYTNIKAGDLVWVPCRYLARFSQEVLPYTEASFILIVNDGDESFPVNSGFKSWENFYHFVNHEKIIHVFTQNYDLPDSHPKISPIPIGIDFHTLAFKDEKYWGVSGTPKEQEDILHEIIKNAKPVNERIKKAFIDFQHSDSMRGSFQRYLQFGEDRTQIFQKLKNTPFVDYSDKLDRTKLWQKKIQYAFSISPPGNGLDCHRTWEDLALGCIVIVKKTHLDPVFEGLPVVCIQDWSEINEQNLDKWLNQFSDTLSNPAYRERITLKYWLDKIKSKIGSGINSKVQP